MFRTTNRYRILTKVLLVIAHPDDESMFFLPTIFTLQKKSDFHLLCLSTGNSDGKGEIRAKELEKCCKEILKIETVHIVDDERLKDGMNQKWDIDVVSSIIKQFSEQHSIEEAVSVKIADTERDAFLQKLWKVYDSDNIGTITIEQFQSLVIFMRWPLENEVIKTLQGVRERGKLTMYEFMDWCKRYQVTIWTEKPLHDIGYQRTRSNAVHI